MQSGKRRERGDGNPREKFSQEGTSQHGRTLAGREAGLKKKGENGRRSRGLCREKSRENCEKLGLSISKIETGKKRPNQRKSVRKKKKHPSVQRGKVTRQAIGAPLRQGRARAVILKEKRQARSWSSSGIPLSRGSEGLELYVEKEKPEKRRKGEGIRRT